MTATFTSPAPVAALLAAGVARIVTVEGTCGGESARRNREGVLTGWQMDVLPTYDSVLATAQTLAVLATPDSGAI